MLMSKRSCMTITEKGEPCRQAPLRGDNYCFGHSPEHTQEAAEARRRFSPLHHVFEESGRCASPMNC